MGLQTRPTAPICLSTIYWIVHAIDEAASQINLLRYWNASRDTRNFRF
jgi:hypothetical protein